MFLVIFLYAPVLFACGNPVTLSWIPPSTNSDGSPLTDINGYEVYYGNISGNYTQVINAGKDTAYQICDLTEGLTYYFAVTAYDTSGNESIYSYEVSKTIVSSTLSPVSDTLPTTSFTGYPASGTPPLTVNFSNTSSGHDGPFTYEWDFDGDGTVDSTAGDPSYTFTNQGTYTVELTVRDSDGSVNAFTRTNYITVSHSYTLDCTDGGGIECLQRTDGGSDSDNLVDGKPKADVEYEFRINIKDTSGRTPQYVKLYMAQRHYPTDEDFYGFRMSCDGNFISGGLCSYVTQLGPAAVHKFYFMARFFDGTVRRYPETGYITGPDVQLLTGHNLVGAPRNTGDNNLDGYEAFGSTDSYRWNGGGYYSQIKDGAPVKQGEGYYIVKQAATLPELAEYGEIQDAEFAYELKPGWNIISDPYSGNIALSAVTIRKGSDTTASWMEAASGGWVANPIYYWDGIDWGDNFIPIRPPQAKIVPWRGYWMYLYMTDDIYYLVIPKPRN